MQNHSLGVAEAPIFDRAKKLLSVVEILDLKIVAPQLASNFFLFLCDESFEKEEILPQTEKEDAPDHAAHNDTIFSKI
jgi:hypothetical protein